MISSVHGHRAGILGILQKLLDCINIVIEEMLNNMNHYYDIKFAVGMIFFHRYIITIYPLGPDVSNSIAVVVNTSYGPSMISTKCKQVTIRAADLQ